MSKDIVTVYWCPGTIDEKNEINWSIFYEDPENCYLDLSQNLNKNNNKNNFFRCPPFKKIMTNTFLIRNPIKSHLVFDQNKTISKLDTSIYSEVVRPASIINNITFDYHFFHYFFCEEDIDVFKMAPFFHNAPHLQYGAVIPATWNAGSWVRSIRNEFNLWQNINEMVIEEGEPISYYIFNTDKKVILKRFYPTERFLTLAMYCSYSTNWEPNVPLLKRYQRFKNSKIDKIILKEIKNNLIED